MDFQNYDVIRGHRIRSLGEFATSSELQFSDQAIDYMSPRGVFDILGECFLSTKEDLKRLCAAVVRQAIHLASDKYCVEGLPIPILSSIDPQKAQELIEKGLNSIEFGKLVKHDLLQIGASAAISTIINLIIEAIYLFCIQSNLSMDVRRVKIKKIIRISDVISSSSNLLYVSLTKNINKLDIGGIGVTMINLLRSNDFIIGVKREYISENFNALVTNE